ncbi:hypothetical protein FKM82_008225 [Ascaphus truei]
MLVSPSHVKGSFKYEAQTRERRNPYISALELPMIRMESFDLMRLSQRPERKRQRHPEERAGIEQILNFSSLSDATSPIDYFTEQVKEGFFCVRETPSI